VKEDRLEFRAPSSLVTALQVLMVFGGVTLFLGLALAPQRIWPNLLLAALWLLGVGLGGIAFVALQYVSGAEWSVAFRRVPEAMSAALKAGALLLAVILLGYPKLYPWVGKVWEDPEGTLWFKRAWLSQPFFLARSAVYLLTWLAFASAIVRTSRRQDESGEVELTRKNARLSAAFLVVFGLTFCLASFDWIMSLEPLWFSTIFGVYNFAGVFSSGLAVLIILAVWLQRQGALAHAVTEQHLLDLGRLLFAFCTFWMYTWFSQYMLIWYANIPEETAYFIRRTGAPWGALFLLNMLLNWAVPFLALLPRASKRNPRILVKVAWVIVAGRFLDLYLMIFPPLIGPKPALGVWEVGIWLGGLALTVLVVFRALARAPLVPLRDPSLAESLYYHQ
jgi:hypothetical protein